VKFALKVVVVGLCTIPLFCETNNKDFPSALSRKQVTLADVLTKKGNGLFAKSA